MNSTKIFLLVVLNCASLKLSAGALPNPPTDLLDAIFNRPRFVGGGGGIYGGTHLSRFAIVGNILYVADGPMGLAIYNVTDPARPRQVGAYPTDTSAFAVRIAGTHALLMTPAGTLILDVRDPTNPQALDSPGTGFNGIENKDREKPEAEQAIVAVVGDRAYISRDDGVVVIELHGLTLPSPMIARRMGADPISTGAWLPNRSAAQESSMEARAQGAHAANPTEASMPMAKEEGFVPTEQPSRLAPPSPQPITITGWVESGVFRLLVSGLPGQPVLVQRSSSITGGWEAWQTITLADAPTELTDEDAAGVDQIFYRVVSP
jgi:LVIVD repeat